MTQAQAPVGLFGKHPGYGDFLRAGLSEPVADAMSRWLDGTLAALRDEMGNDWAAFWDGAQELRFWVGRAVLGRTLAGILRPSQDRVGRRYPLVLMVEGAAAAAPVVDPDQGLWDGLAAHMQRMQPGQGGKALLDGLTLTPPAEDPLSAATGPTLWAHHPEADLGALLRSAAAVDADRAMLTRSYWWATGGAGRAAVWLGCPGLPEAPALGWLLAGVPGETGQEAPDA